MPKLCIHDSDDTSTLPTALMRHIHRFTEGVQRRRQDLEPNRRWPAAARLAAASLARGFRAFLIFLCALSLASTCFSMSRIAMMLDAPEHHRLGLDGMLIF